MPRRLPDALSLPEKTCVRCGRRMVWRRKWAANWAEVKYCSDACRRQKLSATDVQLEAAIVELLASRSGSICPSEAARRVRPDDWREYMEAARRAGRRLAACERVRFQQKGQDVDPSRARGPLRLVRGPAFDHGQG